MKGTGSVGGDGARRASLKGLQATSCKLQGRLRSGLCSLQLAACGSNKVGRSISRVLSWTAIHLGPASPRASSDLPESSAGRANGFLFGLAPGGVYPATAVASGAVRSYRTFSPLPDDPKNTGRYVFCGTAVTTPSPAQSPGVTWHPALWSPDFPPVVHTTSGCLTDPPRSV